MHPSRGRRRPARTASSLWGSRDFMRLWGGQAVSELGSAVTMLALPLLAVSPLHASTFEVALLSAAGSAAFLVVALQAGALVDRWRKKRVMVWSDVLRAALLATVPLAQAAGVLTLAQLYVVALATSVLTVFFDVAYQSYLPILVNGDQLVDGNAKIAGSQSFAQVAGPSIGGALVSAFGAAYALVADVASFAVSTVLTSQVRDPEPPPTPQQAGIRMRDQVREGLEFVLRHPVLRKVVGCTATFNFFSSATEALVVVFLVRVLHASPWMVGGVFALGAVGGLAGAALAAPLARRVGGSRIIWISILCEVPFLFGTPLAFSGWGVLLVSLTAFGGSAAAVVYNVAQVSYRQAVTPAPLLGRMNASTRFIVWGVNPLGALAAGALASVTSIRTSLLVAAVGASLAGLWVLASPLRTARDLTDLPPGLGMPRDAAAQADELG